MGIRTPDLPIANGTLYQLSYDPLKKIQNATPQKKSKIASRQKFVAEILFFVRPMATVFVHST